MSLQLMLQQYTKKNLLCYTDEYDATYLLINFREFLDKSLEVDFFLEVYSRANYWLSDSDINLIEAGYLPLQYFIEILQDDLNNQVIAFNHFQYKLCLKILEVEGKTELIKGLIKDLPNDIELDYIEFILDTTD